MEISSKPQYSQNPSFQSSSSSCSSSSSLTPKISIVTATSDETTPYPTTFIQADTASFKQVVQMLTGSSSSSSSSSESMNKQASNKTNNTPPIKKPGFKLYERRNSNKSLKNISSLMPGLSRVMQQCSSGFSPRTQLDQMILSSSPSVLDHFPSLVLSPITPLIPDPFNRSPTPSPNIADQKDQSFHVQISSPISIPRDSEPPRLLPLFPVTSPRVTGSSSSSSR